MSQLAILVPVLNRPHRIEPLLASITSATQVPHRVIFGCSDQPTVDELDRVGAAYIRDEGGAEGTYAKRINRLFNATNEPICFLAADDLAFRPGWFETAMTVMNRIDGAVGINDLHNSATVHFLVSRNYINTLGGCVGEPGIVLHEGYVHAYCDDEFRSTAMFHGRFERAMDSVVEHLHAGAGKLPHDDVYAMGEASMPQGLAVLQSRSHLWGA